MQAVLDLTGGRGADVVITAAASGAAQEQAVRMAARRGRISLFGGLPKDKPTITLDANLVHYRELLVAAGLGRAGGRLARSHRRGPRVPGGPGQRGRR